jgi:DNA polymerase-1
MKGNPVADAVLEYRDAKKQCDYFHGFLYHSDAAGVVHTNLTRDGTVTGRFSSSNPNFQNHSRVDGSGDGFEVRGALVPREGFSFYIMDFVGAEFRLMLDMAGAEGLCRQILDGHDPHQATADMVGITRQQAKTLNFAILFGSGPRRIGEMLKIPEPEAKALRDNYFRALPEVRKFITQTTREAENNKMVRTWLGRALRFPSRDTCYRAVNHKIQGGAADICKWAIVACHGFLAPYKSRMVLTVHDSIVFEIAYGEEHLLPTLKKLMIAAYPYRILPMDVSVEFAPKNMAETTKVEI